MSEKARTQIALAQVTAGLRPLREILRQDQLIEHLYFQKFFKMELISNLLSELAKGTQFTDKRSKEERDRRLTTVYSEFKTGIV